MKGELLVVEHRDKDQAGGLDIAELFIQCGHQAFKTHIKSIAIFMHGMIEWKLTKAGSLAKGVMWI
jgi:hypothetical protein